MKTFDAYIRKINFKKVLIIYLIAAILAGIFSVCFLGFAFKDKLALAYHYDRVLENVERDQGGMEALQPELTALADKSPDIVDILILSSENKIIYSAKNSALAQNGSLNLTGNNDRENRYLTDKANSNVVFRLVKRDRLILLKALIDDDDHVNKSYFDDYFYDAHFNAEKVYLLSYVMDQPSGNKIYFISNIHPVANGEFYVKAVLALGVLFFMIYWVLVALWVYANAQKSKLNATMWGIIALMTNLAGLLVYLIYKQGCETCYKCGAVQSKTNRYCTFCGAKLNETCPGCNTPVNGKDNYCKTCGHKLDRA